MNFEKGRVRAPEIGRIWINSPPLSLRQLRGKAVLIDFWDYTCVNCIRTLPYLEAWHERYREMGLVVIGVHTPEFTFAQYESNVERGVAEFGLTYPVVVDSNYELWNAFANRYWPAKYLIDKDGYLRYAHFGEGAYGETETAIQQLLGEINPAIALPEVMTALRPEDSPGAVCYQPTPELYLGHRRGRLGNPEGLQEDKTAEYSLPAALEEGLCYLDGRWASTAEYLEALPEQNPSRLLLKYSASGVNLVMAPLRTSSCEVELRQDGRPLAQLQATRDTQFRGGEAEPESYIVVDRARMYTLLDNRGFGPHTLELACRTPGLAVFAFTFTGCVRSPEEGR